MSSAEHQSHCTFYHFIKLSKIFDSDLWRPDEDSLGILSSYRIGVLYMYRLFLEDALTDFIERLRRCAPLTEYTSLCLTGASVVHPTRYCLRQLLSFS